jgi:hypothetical protein
LVANLRRAVFASRPGGADYLHHPKIICATDRNTIVWPEYPATDGRAIFYATIAGAQGVRKTTKYKDYFTA